MGDQARIEEFTEYAAARQNHLMRTAYLLCGDWHSAQDLTQTALLNLCKAWNHAKRADSIDAYAQKTLIDAYVRSRRKLRREREVRTAALSGTERLTAVVLALPGGGEVFYASVSYASGAREVFDFRAFSHSPDFATLVNGTVGLLRGEKYPGYGYLPVG